MSTLLTPVVPAGDPALSAYEALAPYYDRFTAGYAHDRWLDGIEALALEHGLAGRRVFDAACGTGSSFVPLLERGYAVEACDISPAMVDVARGRHPGGAERVFVADVRELGALGPYDLVTWLDDAANYLVGEGDLEAALRSLAGVLAPSGLLVFDVNTLSTYAGPFAAHRVVDRGDVVFCWHGEGGDEPAPGSCHSAVLDVFAPGPGGCWQRSTSTHVQRHHPRARIEAACARAGLELVDARGQRPGARLDREADELLHPKVLYVARPAGAAARA